jgi:hypothetical protein
VSLSYTQLSEPFRIHLSQDTIQWCSSVDNVRHCHVPNKQTPWSESASELYRPSDSRLWAKLVPTFADRGVPRGQRDGSLRPYSRVSRPEPLLFLPSSSSVLLTRLSGPRSRPTTSQEIFHERQSLSLSLSLPLSLTINCCRKTGATVGKPIVKSYTSYGARWFINCLFKCPSPVPILFQINPVHVLKPHCRHYYIVLPSKSRSTK